MRSLSSGLTDANGDSMSCDKTEQVGAKINELLDMAIVSELIR